MIPYIKRNSLELLVLTLLRRFTIIFFEVRFGIFLANLELNAYFWMMSVL